jgi:hypothetical protein
LLQDSPIVRQGERRLVGEIQRLRGAPWPLWLSVGIGVVSAMVGAVLGDFDGTPAPAIGIFVVVSLLLAWLLLRGSKVVWVVSVAIGAFDLFSVPFLEPPWWSVGLTIVDLALLLAPASFEYVWGRPLPFRRMRPGK